MSKNVGKIFEEDFINSVEEGIFHYRFRDLPFHLTRNAKYEVNNNPADFLIFHNYLFILELKSCGGTSLPCTNIRDNQVNGLYKYNKMKGVVGGFVINFRKYNETYFLPIEDYLSIIKSRASIGIQEARAFGIHVEQKLKRTRYTYDVSKFLNEFIKR